jgi:hypothetical protein
MTIRRAVVLIGNAKPAGTSTSESLARYLIARLEAGGVEVLLMPVVATRGAAGAAKLAAALAEADLFVLATPLYADSLPYLVTHAFEELAAARAAAPLRTCAFAAIINCGFPQVLQCRTALDIARLFARRAHLTWAGGLALGEGGVIDGRPLAQLGFAARHIRAALDSAATALLAGSAIPDAAIKSMARPAVPIPLYSFLGNMKWKRQARRNGVGGQIGARPFAD